MRRNLLVIITLSLLMPFAASADEKEFERKIEKRVIVTNGGEEAELEEIMEMVEAEIGDETNVEVYVTKDENGEVTIEKFPGKPGKHAMHVMRAFDMADMADIDMDFDMPGIHGVHRVFAGPHAEMGRLSEAAADCVLKNIKNASSDSAAMAVVKACRTLNPKSE